jgi:hypothetical protein
VDSNSPQEETEEREDILGRIDTNILPGVDEEQPEFLLVEDEQNGLGGENPQSNESEEQLDPIST